MFEPGAEVLHLTGRSSRHAPLRSLTSFHVSAFRHYWKHGSLLARVLAPLLAVGLTARFDQAVHVETGAAATDVFRAITHRPAPGDGYRGAEAPSVPGRSASPWSPTIRKRILNGAWQPSGARPVSPSGSSSRTAAAPINAGGDRPACATAGSTPNYPVCQNVGFAVANNRAVERLADCSSWRCLDLMCFPKPAWLAALVDAAANPKARVICLEADGGRLAGRGGRHWGTRSMSAASPGASATGGS